MTRLFTLALLLIAPTAVGVPAGQTGDSLYKRIGGYDAIAAVTDDFIGRLGADPQISRFFAGHSTDSKKKLRQHVVDLVCMSTGGPCAYAGRDMRTTHTGLGITSADWETSRKHFVATLDKFKVPEKEKQELVALVESLRKDIVEK